MGELEEWSSYIDEPYLNGVLSGVLLGLLAIWVVVGANAVVQAWLRARFGETLKDAGFAIDGWGLRPRVTATRAEDRVFLEGGVVSPRVRIRRGASWVELPLDEVDPQRLRSEVQA